MPHSIERTEDRLSRVPETALDKRIGVFRPMRELLEREQLRLPLLVITAARRRAGLFLVKVADVPK
jgi:hypothetical protein